MSEGYYKTSDTVQEYIRLAKGVSGIEIIEKLKQFLPSNSTLLEIGSGPGTDFEILNKTYKIIGSDNSSEFIKHLINKYPKEEFLELDATSIEVNKKFNGIYSNKVMHHLNDSEIAKSVKKQHDVLNANGIICHTFWKGEGSEVFKGLFVKYHTIDSLKNIFQNYFEIICIENYNEFDEDDSLMLIGKKK